MRTRTQYVVCGMWYVVRGTSNEYVVCAFFHVHHLVHHSSEVRTSWFLVLRFVVLASWFLVLGLGSWLLLAT